MILLFESKLDKQKFIEFAGEELANKFFRLKPKMKSPYNDMYYWMEAGIKGLTRYIDLIENQKTSEEMRKEAKSGAKLLVDENGWKVYEILNYPAAVYYGKNTKWCVSSTDGHGPLYWDINITKRNARLFFFIHGNDEKYAVVLRSYTDRDDGKTRRYAEVWNQEDRNLTVYHGHLPDGCPVIDELADTNAYKD